MASRNSRSAQAAPGTTAVIESIAVVGRVDRAVQHHEQVVAVEGEDRCATEKSAGRRPAVGAGVDQEARGELPHQRRRGRAHRVLVDARQHRVALGLAQLMKRGPSLSLRSSPTRAAVVVVSFMDSPQLSRASSAPTTAIAPITIHTR